MLWTGFGGPLCAKKSRATFCPSPSPPLHTHTHTHTHLSEIALLTSRSKETCERCPATFINNSLNTESLHYIFQQQEDNIAIFEVNSLIVKRDAQMHIHATFISISLSLSLSLSLELAIFIKIFINANNAYIYVSFCLFGQPWCRCSRFMLIILLPLSLKCGPEGLAGPSPYPYASNQKRFENRGERARAKG